MSNIISPNMSLVIPTVGSEAGPTYAFDINSSLTIIDQHNHSAGSGVQITPAGININTSLPLNGNFLTTSAGMTMTSQLTPPSDLTVYVNNNDLYYVDGVGNNVRITQSGGVAGSPGSISGLTSPASASYVAGSSTFVWQSGVSLAANMDFASAILRNISPNSTFGLTLEPPAALANDYTLTLPTVPSGLSFMTLDASGNIGTSTGVSGAQIAAGTITGTQIASNTITGGNIAPSTVTGGNIASGTISNSNIINHTITSLQQVANFTTSSNLSGSSSSSTFTNCGGTNLTTSGGPVRIDFYPTIGGIGTDSSFFVNGTAAQMEMILQRNGTTIASILLGDTSGITHLLSYPPASGSVFDYGATGSPANYSYILLVRLISGSGTVGLQNCVMVLTEVA